VRGLEFDYQTNFRWAPKPLDGIVLSANLSLISSSTFYPFFRLETELIDEPPLVISRAIEGEREGNLPGQSDILANVSLGYEKKGFSGRISMLHQGQALFSVGSRVEGDIFTIATTRWDLSLSQRINDTWKVFLNFNNITNQEEAAFFGEERFLSNLEFFGFTIDVGVSFKLRK
jgi:outer membrane receptor protein involved in Fe transport